MSGVIAVTGYKPHELGIFTEQHPGIEVIKHTLRSRIIQLIEVDNIEWFITSGQPGVELWASEIVIDIKKDYPNVSLGILTPFYEQESRWADSTKEKYYNILEQSDYVDSITKRPYDSPAQLKLKNDFIINKSQGILIVYDDETPGTPNYYLTPARKKFKETNGLYKIITITKFDIELAEQEIRERNPEYWSQTD